MKSCKNCSSKLIKIIEWEKGECFACMSEVIPEVQKEFKRKCLGCDKIFEGTKYKRLCLICREQEYDEVYNLCV